MTEADKASHNLIVEHLQKTSPYLIVSEESEEIPDVKGHDAYWLLDPLDGTKHFLKRDGEFVISLALVHKSEPHTGFIYAPVSKEFYYAEKNKGAYFNSQRILNENQGPAKKAYSSGFHKREESKEFRESLGMEEFFRLGSALKYGRMARGLVDIYPRFGETYEWDIAAGQIILEESGCLLWDLDTLSPMSYGKPNYLNKGFIAFRKNLKIKNQLKSLIEKRASVKKGRANG